MILPMIHLNGTSKDNLLEDCTNAITAGREFLTMLERAAPNGRDYYPIGPGATQKAQEEHADRMAKVRSIVAELEAIAEHVDKQ